MADQISNQEHVAAFEKAMLNYFTTVGKPVWNELDSKKELSGDIEKRLVEALNAFKSTWKPAAEKK